MERITDLLNVGNNDAISLTEEEKYPPSNNPSLYSHKGTVIRLCFYLNNGDSFIVEPLRYSAGALVLFPEIAQQILSVEPLPSGKFHLISNSGCIVRSFEAVPRESIKYVESFVVYPNGATWEGTIFEGDIIKELNALVWSWDIAHNLVIPELKNSFGFGSHWIDVPTIVGLLDILVSKVRCPFAQHSCPKKCNGRTKIF